MYVMTAQSNGQLANVPQARIEQLVAAMNGNAIDGPAVVGALSALQRMPEPDRARIFAALDSVPTLPNTHPPVGITHIYALLGREQFGLNGGTSDREGSIARL